LFHLIIYPASTRLGQVPQNWTVGNCCQIPFCRTNCKSSDGDKC